jgi:hypothetical protein
MHADVSRTLYPAHTEYLCVPYDSHSKQRVFPQTALTGWSLSWRRSVSCEVRTESLCIIDLDIKLVQTVISKLLPIIPSKAPAQLLSPAHNKVHFPTLYPFRSSKLYPPSEVLLIEGRAGTTWEPSRPEIFLFLSFLFDVLSHTTPSPHFLFSVLCSHKTSSNK